MNEKDICFKLNVIYLDVKLVMDNSITTTIGKIPFLFYALFLLKNKGDIVNTIMEMEFM